MKKIAIIIDGDLVNRKGQVNASLNRIKYLKSIADYKIDVYAIQNYEGTLIRFLRKTTKRERLQSMQIDGIDIKLLWKRFSLLNYLLVYKLKYKALSRDVWNEKNSALFKTYDIISSHSIACGRLALSIHSQYGIPYYVTWHGSDIHTLPYANKFNWEDTVKVLEHAENNFFVSKALMDSSDCITLKARKQLLYNGVNEKFITYPEEKRKFLKKQFGVNDGKIIAFIGNLFPIKNVLLLPEIFKKVYEHCGNNVTFWIIGDGKLLNPLKLQLKEFGLNCKFWGNQSSEKMPDFMNAIDILVLPSKNEGLPLVTVEALACGSNVVGSNVGGIGEAIGFENVFELNEDFIDSISNRIICMLESKVEQSLNPIFDWKNTALIEHKIYLKRLNKQ